MLSHGTTKEDILSFHLSHKSFLTPETILILTKQSIEKKVQSYPLLVYYLNKKYIYHIVLELG